MIYITLIFELEIYLEIYVVGGEENSAGMFLRVGDDI